MPCDTTIVQAIDSLLQRKKRAVIAIDGRSAAGKTTLATELQEHYDAAVIHMDDFFLRPEQRTPERYARPGGNVDWERFSEEVLRPLKEGTPFAYRRFDCRVQQLRESVAVPAKALTIVEGSYACHPDHWDHYDLHIFLTVDPQPQMERILHRNGAERAEMFRAKWIPLEEAYFAHFQVAEKCELYL